jgi:hypothetical protein
MGTDLRNVTENLRLLHNPKTAREDPHLHSSASRNKETWWEKGTGETTSSSDLMDGQSKDDSGETEYMWDSTEEQDEEDTKQTAYMWDSMDEQDREDTMDRLKQTDKWVIWKSEDKWSTSLQAAGFHQLLHIHQYIQDECYGFKSKGWWRTRDIRVKKPKKIFEFWVRNKAKAPSGAQESITTALRRPIIASARINMR